MFKNVLVTGGSGFIGHNLQLLRPSWTYASRKDCNLLNLEDTKSYLKLHRFDAIIHLAGLVGGIKENSERSADFGYVNTAINNNILKAAHDCNINRVLSSLSTCAFPDNIQYPFDEKSILKGPPTTSNITYGYAKRLLHIMSLAYRKQYGRYFSTFAPANVYGLHNNFGESGHFVAALVKKVYESDRVIELWGTGSPLRQQLYVGDLCEIIVKLLDMHYSTLPIIVAPNENLSIKKMAEIGLRIKPKNVIDRKIKFDGKLDGQYRKDGSNCELLKLIGDYNFTSFEDGFKKTYDWYKNKMEKK